ncbi:MAG: murein biosynthesis integral membrane protein MurJ, partial [Oleibacter sp.]|nr:murein biosynthesis integral membrane protein MurJ [Thalassolituus sp.]
AFTPVILNIVLIFAALVATEYFSEPLFALAWGVFFAGLFQFVFQLPFLARLRLLVPPAVHAKDPGVRRIGKLMIPALFGVSVSQINLLLDTMLASFLEDGSVSWLYYSDRLSSLPLGVFAIAIGVVILPALSTRHALDDQASFSRTLDWAIRMVFFIATPAALALMLLAMPLMSTIFYYGEVTAYDVGKMTLSLQAYSLGLLAFMLIKVIAPGYYARQDTKTPVKIGIQAMIVNMVLNLILVVPFAHAGLALATSLSAFYNVFMLYRGLRQQNAYQPQAGWLRFTVVLVVANALLGGVIYWLMQSPEMWLDWQATQRISQMCIVVAVGIVVYLAVLIASGLRLKHIRGDPF